MKTSEMKEIVESQRYFLAALLCMVTYIEDENLKNIAKEDIEKLWTTTEIMNESFKLNVKSFDEIVQHGKEIMALNKLYVQEYDKTKLN